MKNKKALTQVVSIGLLLVVIIGGFAVLSGWYQNFSTQIQNKKYQELGPLHDNLKYMSLKIGEKSYELYFKKSSSGYLKVEEVTFNDKPCKIVGSNVFLGPSISKIDLECENIQIINDAKIVTKQGIISNKAILKDINNN